MVGLKWDEGLRGVCRIEWLGVIAGWMGSERSFPERRRPIERLKNSLAYMSNL